GCPEFDKLWDHERRPEVPEADYAKAEADMIRICREFKSKHPEMAAIMLECTGMQMFARAIQRELDLPVWSWGTLLDHAWSVVAHRDYYGHI
ncbi:MAG: aspartate/glutamate racemase family protein, partial [Deltaproteobacteria bacterium]|nr:aspartate/glutamate racemase family protein [Deltaproteobacteria bacterium]